MQWIGHSGSSRRVGNTISTFSIRGRRGEAVKMETGDLIPRIEVDVSVPARPRWRMRGPITRDGWDGVR